MSVLSADEAGLETPVIEEISAFGMRMRRDAGTPDGDANQKANLKMFDAWFSKLEGMARRSRAMAPSTASCADFLKTLSPVWQKSPLRPQMDAVVAAASPGAEATDAAEDCQTVVILRAQSQLAAMQDRYRLLCAPPSPADRCRSQFQRAIPGDNGPGIIVQPILSDIETIIWIQASKKPGA